MNRESIGTQSRSRAWVGVLSIIGLMFAATVLGGGAQAAANKFGFHVGDAFLAAVNPDFAPDLAPGLGAELRSLTADEAARLPPRFRAMAALLK